MSAAASWILRCSYVAYFGFGQQILGSCALKRTKTMYGLVRYTEPLLRA